MARYADDIAQRTSGCQVMIDLGAGDCVKAERLFSRLRPQQYVPVDISTEYLRGAVARVRASHPALDIVALGQDFSQDLSLPADVRDEGRLFFYPGSSIGNFTPDEALKFLRRVRERASGGGLLIGVDLVKPHDVLQRAYDDALGVTAAFNLNLLRQLNRLIGSDFEPRQWQHVGLYNEAQSRIEMHLEAREDLVVRWDGAQRRFARGERIHTENSYKYTLERFSALLEAAGFASTRHWSDERGWFAVFWANA